MSFDQYRWRCGCGANNMMSVVQCFRCGSAKPALPPLPVSQPTPAKHAALPWWAWACGAVVIVAAAAIPVTRVIAKSQKRTPYTPAVIPAPAQTQPQEAPPEVLLVWRRGMPNAMNAEIENLTGRPLPNVFVRATKRVPVVQSGLYVGSGEETIVSPVATNVESYSFSGIIPAGGKGRLTVAGVNQFNYEDAEVWYSPAPGQRQPLRTKVIVDPY